MKKLTLLLIALALALAACSGAASQATQPVAPLAGAGTVATVTPEPTPATQPVQPEAPSPDETTAPHQGDALAGLVTYILVPAESTVTYEVGETFLDQGNVFAVAVGKTQGVTGEIQVNFDRPQDSTVSTLTADISEFTSDSGRRDNAIRTRFLQSAQYPTVTFTPTAIEGLPETIEPGVEYPVTLRGDLTIRENTRPAAFEATVRLEGDTLTGQAATTFLMSDYGFGPISVLGILKTEDEVKISVDFVARS